MSSITYDPFLCYGIWSITIISIMYRIHMKQTRIDKYYILTRLKKYIRNHFFVDILNID
jgi:hypothetical protein